MQCPALGEYPGNGQDDLVLKLTPTGVTFLHERRYRSRYIGSTTSAVGINGELWPVRSDYAKMQALKIPSRLIEHSVNGLYYLDKEKYTEATTPKRAKKKQPCPAALNLLIECVVGSPAEQSTAENSTHENNSSGFAIKVAKNVREKSYKIHKGRVRQRILAYINTQKGKKELYFWTVSFPAGTSDNACYQAFNTWLTTLRRPQKTKDGKKLRPMLREYLWVAERQLGERSAPGKAPTYTVHYHIAIPHYMDAPKANAAMRTILKNLAKKGAVPGAVCGKNGDQYYLPSIAKYNGVDICKNRKTRRVVNFAIKKGSRALGNYLTKYVTKNDAGVADAHGNIAIPAFTHLAWHNSRGFSCLFTAVAFSIKEFKKFGFGFFLNRTKARTMEFATFVPWLFGPPPLLEKHLYDLNSFLQNLFDDEQTVHTPGSIAINGTGQTKKIMGA
jgi:hypothetical protein